MRTVFGTIQSLGKLFFQNCKCKFLKKRKKEKIIEYILERFFFINDGQQGSSISRNQKKSQKKNLVKESID